MKYPLYFLVLIIIFSLPFSVSAEPVKVAAIYAHSGIAAQEVVHDLYGIRLAAKIINQHGGIHGRKLTIIELDNKSTPLGARETAREAIRQKVLAVLGSAWSAQSLAMAPILQKARIPMISNISTNPKLTRIGDCIFRICYLDTFQGKIMANFAYADLKARRAAVLTNVSTPYSIDLAKYFKNTFKQLGGKIIREGNYLGTDINFSSLLKKIKRVQPDVVFVPGYMRDSGLILTQARELGIKATFLGGDGWETGVFYYTKGKPLGKNFFCNHWHPGINTEASRKFVKLYYQEFHLVPTAEAATAYDATMLLAQAMRQAAPLTSATINKALAKTRDFPGITGKITLDRFGDPINKPAVIETLVKGENRFVKEVNWQ